MKIINIINKGDTLSNAFNIVNSNFSQINELLKELELIKIEPHMTINEAFDITNSNFSEINSKLERRILIANRRSKLKKINDINGYN